MIFSPIAASPFDELVCPRCGADSHIDAWQSGNGDETDECRCPACEDWSVPINPRIEDEDESEAESQGRLFES